MRATILLFTLLLSTPAVAQTEAEQFCGHAQTLISEVMDARIEGHSAEKVYMAVARETEGEAFHEWFATIVQEVYTLERESLTGSEREDLLGQFFADCIRSARGEDF